MVSLWCRVWMMIPRVVYGWCLLEGRGGMSIFECLQECLERIFVCKIFAKIVVRVIRVEIRIMRNSDTLRAKFVRNSRENRMQCIYPATYVARKDTCTAPAHVINHGPDFACFGGIYWDAAMGSQDA